MIKKRKDAGTKHFNDTNGFIECSNTMDDVYENIDDYNPNRKGLIAFDDMVANIILYLNISLVFITQSYFSVLKDVRLKSTHYL